MFSQLQQLIMPTFCGEGTFLHNIPGLSVADSHHFDAKLDLDPAFYFYGVYIFA
jgi:hypothetical protein